MILKRYTGIIIFFLLLISAPIISHNQYILNIYIFVLLNIITVTGLNLLMGYAGQISLGHAGFVGLGAYLSAILTEQYSVNCWLAMIIAAVIVAVIAFLIALPTLKLKGHYLAMATLGMGIIIYIFFNQLPITGGPSGFTGIPYLSIGNYEFSNYLNLYILIAVFTFMLVLFANNLTIFRIGRALRAIHDSESAASVLGINTYFYKVQIFVLSAVYASISGSLYAHFVTFISPSSFYFNTSVGIVTMVVIGGMGNVWGGIIGATLLTALPEFLRFFEDYDIAIYGLLLIIVLLFLPEGIIGGLKEIWEIYGKKITTNKTNN